jgi:hypothetical protein
MGIRRGVTVITGGGYSGKSTVLNAIAAGIYNHVAGDGRELCITDDSAATITAEDGRAVSCLNISPFIKWIPGGDTKEFTTHHASGSTSQAANIMEAIDGGTALLLIDEDRSATNFMIRDANMKRLIKKEPITPFTDRVRELAKNGVSAIVVIGGSSEYLAVADKIYMMEEFAISDATARAKSITSAARATAAPATRDAPEGADLCALPDPANWISNRTMWSGGFTPYPEASGTEKLEVSDTGFVIIGDERVDIRSLHGIATPAQVDALAFMLRYLQRGADTVSELEILALTMRGLSRKNASSRIDIKANIREMYDRIEKEGLDIVDTGFFVSMSRFLDLPREAELLAAINRMRRTTWTVAEPRFATHK